MSESAGRESDSVSHAGETVVRVSVDGLSLQTEPPSDGLGTSSLPQVRIVLESADNWEFNDEERPIIGIADGGAEVLSTTLFDGGRQLRVKFANVIRDIFAFTIMIKHKLPIVRQGDCLHLVSKPLIFRRADSRPIAQQVRRKYDVAVTEEDGKISVVPDTFSVDPDDTNVLITWTLKSANFRFASNGIQVNDPSGLEFQPDFKSDTVFRLMNKNSSTKVFKYDVNLMHNSGSFVLNCDPTIKNATR